MAAPQKAASKKATRYVILRAVEVSDDLDTAWVWAGEASAFNGEDATKKWLEGQPREGVFRAVPERSWTDKGVIRATLVTKPTLHLEALDGGSDVAERDYGGRSEAGSSDADGLEARREVPADAGVPA